MINATTNLNTSPSALTQCFDSAFYRSNLTTPTKVTLSKSKSRFGSNFIKDARAYGSEYEVKKAVLDVCNNGMDEKERITGICSWKRIAICLFLSLVFSGFIIIFCKSLNGFFKGCLLFSFCNIKRGNIGTLFLANPPQIRFLNRNKSPLKK